jgi:hypothetical protein
MAKQVCVSCGSDDLEHWGDGEYSIRCYRCNDKEIEHSNRRREWDYYHPGTPIPKSELDG